MLNGRDMWGISDMANRDLALSAYWVKRVRDQRRSAALLSPCLSVLMKFVQPQRCHCSHPCPSITQRSRFASAERPECDHCRPTLDGPRPHGHNLVAIAASDPHLHITLADGLVSNPDQLEPSTRSPFQ